MSEDKGHRPRFASDANFLPGLAAVALFVVMGWVFITAEFGDPVGFDQGASVTASIGYAMFNIGRGRIESEGFLVAFEIIDIVLVAALAGGVMLARRDQDVERMSTVADGGRKIADGGRRIAEKARGGEE